MKEQVTLKFKFPMPCLLPDWGISQQRQWTGFWNEQLSVESWAKEKKLIFVLRRRKVRASDQPSREILKFLFTSEKNEKHKRHLKKYILGVESSILGLFSGRTLCQRPASQTLPSLTLTKLGRLIICFCFDIFFF